MLYSDITIQPMTPLLNEVFIYCNIIVIIIIVTCGLLAKANDLFSWKLYWWRIGSAILASIIVVMTDLQWWLFISNDMWRGLFRLFKPWLW